MGLKVVPLGGKGLEPPVLALVVVVPKAVGVVMAAGDVVIVWVSMVVPPVVVGASLLDLVCKACSCPYPGAKKCLADSNASSRLSSLAL